MNQRIVLERDLSFNCTIKGEFYTHFADLFRIFFENILKHADEKVFSINAAIRSELKKDFIEITIANDITNIDSVNALRTILVDYKMNVNKLFEEGKSGYHKAFKILKSDLRNERNALGTQVNDEQTIFSVIMEIQLKEISR